MNFDSTLALVAAFFSAALALAVIFRQRRSIASVCFAAGMLILTLESVFGVAWREALYPENAAFWKTLTLLARSLLPGVWLCFSLTYSRGAPRQSLARSRFLLVAAFLLPIGVTLAFREQLAAIQPNGEVGGDWWVNFHVAAKILNSLLLLGAVLILMNLERTFRAAVGTMQWRIKFMVLGLGVIFGARIYTRSQALLFSGEDLALINVETGALLIGCALIAVAYARRGFGELDIYPSRAVLQTSLTLLLVGSYLFIVGVFAQVAARMGEWENFQLQAFVVLLGIAILAVLLLSNRLRQRLGRFVSRHFKRPQHDFRQIWTRFTQSMSSVLDEASLCNAAARLISETFNVLSVTIWRFDEQQRLTFAASTFQSESEVSGAARSIPAFDLNQVGHDRFLRPFDLDRAKDGWAKSLRQLSSTQFRSGGSRLCLPLLAGDRHMGIAILADRVGALPFTLEELDLLKCIGDQVGASLSNIGLTKKLMLGKEMEAFQTVSAFFIHDLKNAASTLSLMLQNLPMHFDDPSFRADALHGIGSTVNRINHLVGSVGAFRHKLDLQPVEFDLNGLIAEELEKLNGLSEVKIVTKLQPLPKLKADREQLRSVITNLLLNARDAVGTGGQVEVETSQSDGWIAISVTDNGCGMSPAFLRDSLFRPFQTTKKKGLGIGMFQAKMIVEAHCGTVQVQSEIGSGTTFHVMLPLQSQSL